MRTSLALFLIAAWATAFTGCTPMQQPPPPSMPSYAPPAPTISIPPDPITALPPGIRQAYESHSDTVIRDGFAVFYPYHQYRMPVVYCARQHATEIVLAADEQIVGEPTIGDSNRWTVTVEANHVRIKTCPAGCNSNGGIQIPVCGDPKTQPGQCAPINYATNLMIDTDKPRTIHVKLQAGAKAMETVAFWYPDEIASAEQARADALRKAAQQAADPPAKLNFGYRINGPNVPFRPIQAFDDGSHEYILFSDLAALQSDMPSLFVQHGKVQELVNYTTRGNYYVVDRLYTDAALVQGTGDKSSQQIVHITATGAH